jgi:hypothetical protein
MIPLMAAATHSLSPEDMPAATTPVGITRQVFGTAGIALASALLARAIGPLDRAGGTARDADGFRDTYVWGMALIAPALVPLRLLPRGRPPVAPGNTGPPRPARARDTAGGPGLPASTPRPAR